MIKIDLIDQSTRGSAYDWQKIAHAIQTQIRYDVAQAWGTGNSCQVTVKAKPAPGHWPVYILDNSDEPGALGYHETDPNNPVLPIGKVFVKTDEQYGLSPSVTLSHECVEIIGDPMACYVFQATATQLWAVELCDPCESDALGYELEGVLLSDFVTPAWFYGGPGPYTYRNTIPKSRQLAKGGYQAILNATSVRWTQVTAETEPGVTSRARTMGHTGRLHEKRELLAWARAAPQPGLTMPDGTPA